MAKQVTDQPRALSDAELDHVHGGKITAHHVNGGGNEPNGKPNGGPPFNLTPAGHAPSAQNQDPAVGRAHGGARPSPGGLLDGPSLRPSKSKSMLTSYVSFEV